MSIWWKDGQRYDGFALAKLGVLEGVESACGFTLVGTAPPATFTPLFDRLIDVGTSDDGYTAAIIWEVSDRDPVAVRLDLRTQIDTHRDRLLTEGFAYDFGDPIGLRVFQTRDDTDILNWLGRAQEAALQCAASAGDSITGLITADNDTIQVTWAQCLAVMRAMAARRSAIIFHARSLKDSVDRTVTTTELRSIDITSGWPSL